jgi:hypothetical protein
MLSGLIWIISGFGIGLIHYLKLFGGISSPQGRAIFLIFIAAFVGSGIHIVVAQRQEVAEAGFESSRDMYEGKRSGFTNAEAWKAEKSRRSIQSGNRAYCPLCSGGPQQPASP